MKMVIKTGTGVLLFFRQFVQQRPANVIVGKKINNIRTAQLRACDEYGRRIKFYQNVRDGWPCVLSYISCWITRYCLQLQNRTSRRSRRLFNENTWRRKFVFQTEVLRDFGECQQKSNQYLNHSDAFTIHNFHTHQKSFFIKQESTKQLHVMINYKMLME